MAERRNIYNKKTGELIGAIIRVEQGSFFAMVNRKVRPGDCFNCGTNYRYLSAAKKEGWNVEN